MKRADVVISTFCLECTRECTDNYDWITLILNTSKTSKNVKFLRQVLQYEASFFFYDF